MCDPTMDVGTEARRIMVQALSKMYSSRNQRGGIRLHRSLLLTLVMKSARDMYHSARISDSQEEPRPETTTEPREETMDAAEVSPVPPCAPVAQSPVKESVTDKENRSPNVIERVSRKRRGKVASEPDFLPRKKAKMDLEEVRRILQDAALRCNQTGSCGRDAPTLSPTLLPRTVATC